MRNPAKRIDALVKSAIPGSMTFLLAGVAVGVLLLNAGAVPAEIGRLWLTMLLIAYLLLSLPAVAQVLTAGVQPQYVPIGAEAEARGARVMAVLGNGSVHYASGAFISDQLTRRSTYCVFEAARLFGMLHPDWIIASGGVAGATASRAPESELIRDLLVRLGVPGARILLESNSRTTGEQVVNIAKLLQRLKADGPVVVITTPAHMPRAMRLFHEHDVDTIPSAAAGLRYDDARTGWRRWVPTLAALRGSESAIYEYLARVRTAYR